MGDLAPSSLANAPAPGEAGGESHPENAILFVAVSLVLGVICRQIFRGTKVPYTVALLILGIALGAVGTSLHHTFESLSRSSRRKVSGELSRTLALFKFC
jgi:hypothetical protein